MIKKILKNNIFHNLNVETTLNNYSFLKKTEVFGINLCKIHTFS